MKNVQIAKWVWRHFAPIVLVAGLLVWLFKPASIPPAAQLRDAASVVGYLLVIAAASGVAAMATVQFWKVLFLPRAAFHNSRLKTFFGESTVHQVLGLAAPTHKDDSPARNGRPKALDSLLDNPTEVVMGQLRSTADYILLRPQGFEEALFRLAGDAGKVAVYKYFAQLKEEQWSKKPPDSTGRSTDALVDVRFFVEQHLNLVHVSLRERWRKRVRTIAVIAAGFAGLLTVTLSELGLEVKVSVVCATIIWGGFISWLARDLVALVERRRS